MENQIIGELKLINSKVNFFGSGNILYIPKGQKVVLENSTINFNGSNSLVFISNNNISFNCNIFNNSTLFIDTYLTCNKSSKPNINISEETSVVIGRDCLFSSNVWIRTSDPHLIYDCKTKLRISHSKSVLIGDHVWLGQDVCVFKGSEIGSGSIIGAKTLCASKSYCSNSSWGGVPARLVKKDVFFLKTHCNNFTQQDSEKFAKYDKNDYIYEADGKYTNKLLLDFLNNEKDIEKRIEFLNCLDNDKNRFYINEEKYE